MTLRGPALLLATRRIGAIALFGILPLVFAALVLQTEAEWGLLGFDFEGTLWEPGRAILGGESPYPPPLADEIDTGNPSVYPPAALVLATPFSLLPFGLAYWVWTATLVAAILVTLRVLGVRDWRCYTVALGSGPVVFGFALGNIAVLLVPLAAYVWKHRDTALWSGVALGIAIALKLVLWPLVVWLIASRRKGAAFVATATAALSTVAAWAVFGFDGLREYPRLLAVNTELYASHSWSLLAGGVGLGLPLSAARALSSLLGLALLLLAVALSRRPDGDRRAFSLAIVSSIALLPVVWPASFVLVLIPLVLVSPSMGRLWYALAAFWLAAVTPRPLIDVGPPPDGIPPIVWQMHHSPPPTAQIVIFALLLALMTVAFLRTDRAGGRETAAEAVPGAELHGVARA